MKWILNKSQINEQDFESVETTLHVKFPLDFKEIVLKHNGASPEPMTYDTRDTRERVAEYLLSFNDKDTNYIVKTYNILKERLNPNLIPVIQDPFGNYICFDFSKQHSAELYFWEHENGNLEYIAKTFSDFINSLYE